MPITNRVGLAIDLIDGDDCDSLKLQDTTGAYNVSTNPLGYSLPGGITSSDVTKVTSVLNLVTAGTKITFTFTVLNNVITAASMIGIDGLTYNILSKLTSTAWPFISTNQLDLLKDWGAGALELLDGEYEMDYTIEGTWTSGMEDIGFSYTTSDQTLVICNACCCIEKMIQSLDPDCKDCFEPKLKLAQRAQMYLSIASGVADIGDFTKAAANLVLAQAICSQKCTDC